MKPYIRTSEHKKQVSKTISKYFSDPKNRKKHLGGKLFRKGHKPWNKGTHIYTGGGVKKGNIPWNKGKKTGQIVWNKGKEGIYSKEYREKIRQANLGEKCNWWKGGISRGKNKKGYYHIKRLERIARQKGAKGSFTLGEWEALKKKHKYTCQICLKKEPEIKLTIDHIIPLTLNGTNFIDNIQPLCLSCNCRKGNRIKLFEL